MEISKETVQKLTIREKGIDTINVFIENFKPEVGRMTIECFGEAWSYAWNRMGKTTPTIEEFVPSCDVHYLAGKLAMGTNRTEFDEEALCDDVRKYIIQRRLDGELEKDEARDLYDRAEYIESVAGNEDFLYDAYGDGWWECLPERLNPEYEYVCKIINIVKKALEIEKGS